MAKGKRYLLLDALNINRSSDFPHLSQTLNLTDYGFSDLWIFIFSFSWSINVHYFSFCSCFGSSKSVQPSVYNIHCITEISGSPALTRI